MPDLPTLPPGAKLDDDSFGLPPLPQGAKLDAPVSKLRPDGLEDFTLEDGTQTVKRKDGAVYVRDSKGEGWKYKEPKTGVWVPAPSRAPEGRLDQFVESQKNVGRTLLEGIQAPGRHLTGLLHDAANSVGLQSDKSYLEGVDQREEQDKYQEAVKNITPGGAFSNFVGEAAPATAAFAAGAGPAATEGLMPSVPTTVASLLKAAKMSGQAGLYSYLTSRGGQGDRAKAGLLAAEMVPGFMGVASGAGLAINAGRNALARSTSKTGRWLANELGIEAETIPGTSATQSRIDAAKKEGVQLSEGDATGNLHTRGDEDFLLSQSKPFLERRLKTANEVRDFANRKDLLESQRASLTPQTDTGELLKIALSGGKRSRSAIELRAEIAKQGLPRKAETVAALENLAQNEGDIALFKEKLVSDKLFNKAEAASRSYGETNPSHVINVLEDLSDKIKKNTALPENIRGYFDRQLAGFAPGTPEVPSIPGRPAQVDYLGTPRLGTEVAAVTGSPGTPRGPQDLTFKGQRELLSTVSADIRALAKDTTIPKPIIKYYQEYANAIRENLSHFANEKDAFGNLLRPKLAATFNPANEHYLTKIVPWKETAFDKAFANEDALKLGGIFKGGNIDQQTRAFNLLPPRGQAAMRAAKMKEIIDAGRINQQGAQGIMYDPNGSLAAIKKLQDGGTADLLFPGGEIRGMAQILSDTSRVGNLRGSVAGPKLGESVAEAAVVGHKTLGLGRQLWLRANASRLAKLYGNPGGSKFLRAIANTEPGSPEYEALMKQLPGVLSSVSAND